MVPTQSSILSIEEQFEVCANTHIDRFNQFLRSSHRAVERGEHHEEAWAKAPYNNVLFNQYREAHKLMATFHLPVTTNPDHLTLAKNVLSLANRDLMDIQTAYFQAFAWRCFCEQILSTYDYSWKDFLVEGGDTIPRLGE